MQPQRGRPLDRAPAAESESGRIGGRFLYRPLLPDIQSEQQWHADIGSAAEQASAKQEALRGRVSPLKADDLKARKGGRAA